MSDKWEIVGKAKKTKSSIPPNDTKLDKKGVLKKPTYEEIRKWLSVKGLILNSQMLVSITVPKYAIKNMHSDNNNKENKKANGNAKIIKKVAKVSQPLPPAPPKVKGISVLRKPSSIEAAFENFNIDELNAEIETLKANFPNNHLVWLKGVSFLVVAILYEQLIVRWPFSYALI